MQYILYLEDAIAIQRKGQKQHIVDRIKDAGYDTAFITLSGQSFTESLDRWVKEHKLPVATIRWDEHGGLYGDLRCYRQISKWCYDHSVAPLGIDFAYFNHYEGYMIDLLEENGDSSIRREFNAMGDNVLDIADIKGKLGEYIQQVRTIYNRHKFINSLKHTTPTYKIAAFTQSLMNRCRLQNSNDPGEWIKSLYNITGKDIIFKTQPAPFVNEFRCNNSDLNIVNQRELSNISKPSHYNIEVNAAISSNAECCIINSSGVSSEFIINNIPVIATGKSWFNGLNIFHEPKSWADLKIMIDSRTYNIGPTQSMMRRKWITWWIRHQFLKSEPTTIIQDCIDEFRLNI